MTPEEHYMEQEARGRREAQHEERVRAQRGAPIPPHRRKIQIVSMGREVVEKGDEVSFRAKPSGNHRQ